MYIFRSLLIIIVLQSVGQIVAAQNKYTGVWKKRVARTISLPETEAGKQLPFLLYNAVISGKLKAYSKGNTWFSTPVNISALKKSTIQLPDTTLIDSPQIGRQFIKITYHTFDELPINKIRIIEDWTYYPAQRKTVINIFSVAPAMDVIGETGDYRGAINLFYVRWKDILPLLEAYRKTNQAHAIDKLIWQDFFKDSSQMTHPTQLQTADFMPGKPNTRTVLHNTTLADNSDGEYYKDGRYLREHDFYTDSIPLVHVLYAKAQSGKIKAYRDPEYKKQLTANEVSQQYNAKTVSDNANTIIDPIAGQNVERIAQRSPVLWEIQTFRVKELWVFDPAKGKTEITYTGIAPVLETFSSENKSISAKPLFWFRYNEVADLLNRFAEYHPANSIERHLWHDRFMEWKTARENRK